MTWTEVLADHLDRGGPIRLCADCGWPHVASLVTRRAGGTEVITEAALNAEAARLQAAIDGRRPLSDCACRCCAPITAANERALTEAMAPWEAAVAETSVADPSSRIVALDPWSWGDGQ